MIIINNSFENKCHGLMIDATLYYPIFIYSVCIIGFILGMKFIISPGNVLQARGTANLFMPLILCTAYALFIGGRPVSHLFGDTVNYAHEYWDMQASDVRIDWAGEWVWQWFMATCKSLDLPVEWFFTIIDLVYFLTALWAVKIFMPDNVMLGIIFAMSSLMFYTYSTNGIRNGMACHILLLAIALVFSGKYVAGCILGAIAFGIHRSTALPIASCIAAMFIFKNVKFAIYFWLACIPLSLVAGGSFIGFFAGLGFDERMTQYATIDETEGFSSTGFRWDFLLYSSMPLLMAWWVCIKKRISDKWYTTLITMYCLSNAFWILVIRSNFSNRFAYLSWFMYPIAIAYPLIMLPVWEDQDQKIGIGLYIYMAFTVIMGYFWRLL